MSARVEGSSLFSPDGRPPLHVAADLLVSGATGASKVCHIFETLLKNRADPNSRSGPLDETPLQVVLRQGEAEARIDAARVLLDYGADPNMTDNCGEGPLFEATCNGDEKACQLLLKYGAKPAGVGGPGADAAARAQPRLAEGARTELGKERPATEVPQNAVLSMKYVRAQGKEWALKKLSPACRGDNGGSDQSTDGDCSAALSSSDDDADFRKGCKAPTIRAITSYLMSDEETCVNVYLKLEELFEGASEVFVDEGAFEMQVSAEHLIVRAHGPTSREGSDEVCWELSAPLPAAVDAEHAGLRLRRGRLTAKLPKAAGLPRRLSAEEEARAEAQGLVPEAAPVKASRPGRGAAQRQGAPQACEAQVAARVAAEEAVRAYGGLGAPATQDGSIFRRKAFPWRTSEFSALAPGMHFRRQEVRAELAQDLHIGLQGGKSTPDIAKGREPGGEEARLCGHCRLPVGDLAYVAEGQEPSYLHGECIAQLRVLDLQKEDKARLREAAELKKKRRAKYDIGWKADRIPRSMGPASKLGLGFVPQGMCCLVYDKESHSIGVLPTLDPMGSVNLEYLSLALQVRFSEGREPAFSLDLATEAAGEPEARVQRKRFDPEWLAGTSAGEVMFQADYHLKELSMGEYEQPVLGMRSCFDYSEAEGRSSEWRAREWFVVRHAEVQVSGDNVLIPCVKMGVEAREQKLSSYGLEDSRITRPDHPLVKYAEEFTRNFDLIAERKSVIYHLRELAKASVLAKYLLEAGVSLDELWFSLAEAKEVGCREVPQLWNERSHSRVQVQDGQIVDSRGGFSKGTHSLYGGVQFGLDIFRIYAAHERLVQGVDLSLDRFSLDSPTSVAQKSDGQIPVGKAFWPSISDSSGSPLREEDKGLLRAVFNPSLSDRRDEGDRFVPPGTSPAYLDSLRALVKEEELVRRQRREHFLSARFAAGDAGPLFPAAWTAAFRIDRGQGAAPERPLRARPDYKAKAQKYEQIVESTAPVFDEKTEDGVRFRVYRLGSVEVRTTQQHDSKEEIGMVFSACAPEEEVALAGRKQDQSVADQARIAKVTEYVEQLPQGPSTASLWTLECRSYVVLETESGRAIVTEMLQDGQVAWKEDPEDLEDRNSLAKVVRSQECPRDAATVGDLRRLRASEEAQGGSGAERRRYTRAAFGRACGSQGPAECAFRRQPRGKWWLAGGAAAHVAKDKNRRTNRDYANKTFTMKFTEKKDGQHYSREQFQELRNALTFLLGVRGRCGPVPQEHEAIFNVRMR